MTKNKIFVGLILSILLISMIGVVSAETYTFNLRPTDEATQEFAFTNNQGEEVNVTFNIVNVITPGAITPGVNLRDGAPITYSFDEGTINNIVADEEVTDVLNLGTADNTAIGLHEADIEAVIIPTAGGNETRVIIHHIEVTIYENTPAIINDIPDFSLEVGDTQEIDVTITDANNDNLTVDVQDEPADMTWSYNDGTLIIAWSPTTTLSETTVTVTANDGYDIASKTFTATAIIAGTSLDIPTIELGSTSQERELLVQTFTLRNTGSEIINNLNIVEGTNTLGFEITQPISTLTPGAETTFTITLDIPLDQDSGKDTIGDLIFNYNGLSKSEDVELTVETNIDFADDIEYDIEAIDGDDDDGTIDNEDNIDVEPGDLITITFKLENQADIKFRDNDILVTVECEDFYDYDEEQESDKDLDDSGDKTQEFEFVIEVPRDTDEETVDATILVEAEDDNNAMHTIEIEFTFDVEKPRHSITLYDVSFASRRVQPGKTVQIDVELENTGTNDEDRVYVEIRNSNLDIDERFGPFDIEEEDEISRSFTITIPEDAESGDYIFDIESFYSMNVQSDDAQVTLTVYASHIIPALDDDDDDSIDFSPDDNQNGQLLNPAYGEPINKGILGENTITILLIILIVVVLALVIIIAIPSKKN
jgi:hypothetical protein